MFKNLVILSLALTGCAPEKGQDTIAATEYSPEMGPKQILTGIWTRQFEMSKFNFCAAGRENCSSLRFSPDGCWLFSLGEKSGELEKLLGGKVTADESLYVKFEGRESLRRGQYGHLGQYSCEIHGEKLISAEKI